MHPGFRQGDGHARNAPALIRPDADGREHGDIAHNPAMTRSATPLEPVAGRASLS